MTWLTIYVMLTRARELENLILLGMTDQVEDLFVQRVPCLSSRIELPDIILCIWIQPLVGGAICWNKRWLNALEVYWHVWCLLFILLICWQVVSWHDLACLVQRMLLGTHCNAFVIWACAVAVSSFWFCFRRYAAMFDACLFIFVWQVVSWHDLACLVQRMPVVVHCAFVIWASDVAVSSFWLCFRRYAAMFVPGAILKGGQDTTRERKVVFPMQHARWPRSLCHSSLNQTFRLPLSISLDLAGQQKHFQFTLTTPTWHVMVGITRSKVIVCVVFAVFCFGRGHPVFCIFTCSPTTRE